MFDFLKSGGTPGAGPPGKQELSVEMRLLLAFILMGAVLFTTPYFFKAPPPPPPVKKAESTPAPAAPEQKAAQPAAAPGTVAAASSVERVSAQKEETFTLETDLYRIVFGNRGAVVHSWTLKKYPDSNKKPLEVVNTAAAPIAGFPFSLDYKNQKPSVDLNNVLYAIKRSDDGLEVNFEFSDGKVSARKTFQFTKDSYQSKVSTEVTESGVPVPHLLQWRGGFGDMTVPSPVAAQHAVHYDAGAAKLITTEGKEAKNGPVTFLGSFSFSGIEDTYFAALFLPAAGSTELKVFDDRAPTPVNPAPEQLPGVAAGGDGVNRMALFVGPKDVDILKKINPKLEQVVDFGWFSFIAKPLFLVMHWLTDTYIHNYGWSIILMTIFINFALFPLKISSMKSMKKMQALQPQIAAINEKYKNVGMRDPRKQEQNQEVMALYQKHGVNPLGGCMPMGGIL